MKKISAVAAWMLLSGLLATTVVAGANDSPVPQSNESQSQNNQGLPQKTGQGGTSVQVKPNDPGASLNARYQKRIEAKKRAAEMREKLMRESQQQAPQ